MLISLSLTIITDCRGGTKKMSGKIRECDYKHAKFERDIANLRSIINQRGRRNQLVLNRILKLRIAAMDLHAKKVDLAIFADQRFNVRAELNRLKSAKHY